MTESDNVAAAVNDVLNGASVTGSAKKHKVARTSVMRALRRRGVEPKPHPSGEQHHAWIDGRKARAHLPPTPCADA